MTIIVLFNHNLRVSDNRALSWAAARGPIIPLYIFDNKRNDLGNPGAASLWWLQESLKNLSKSLSKLGAPLILMRGDPFALLQSLIKQTGATAVTWNRCYEPAQSAADDRVAEALDKNGVEIAIHEGFLLFNPDTIRSGGGTPYKVFTPFSKACFAAPPPAKPLSAPQKLFGVDNIESDVLEDWKMVPKTAKWPKGFSEVWEANEEAAHKQLADFIDDILNTYKTDRDRPDREGTSRMSPYLQWGQISPHQIWWQIQNKAAAGKFNASSVERYLLEILWREFSWHLLAQFPALPDKPLVPVFAKFPWLENNKALQAWQKGMTGYPIVDAGMRQLWQTGWMHNRVRMIVASFLIKHLLIDWREGEKWFWDTLVDADLGNNSASWQWVAGCGADAAPFFRIFNPMLQGQKFDPDGEYVKLYVPELSQLENDYIHEPWLAPPDKLTKAKIILGKTYPKPIVDHNAARKRALLALASLKKPSDENAHKAKLKTDLFD